MPEVLQWEVVTDQGEQHYVIFEPHEVIVGRCWRSNELTDHAGACSYEEFRNGQWHDLIRERFGEEKLQEMLQAAQGR